MNLAQTVAALRRRKLVQTLVVCAAHPGRRADAAAAYRELVRTGRRRCTGCPTRPDYKDAPARLAPLGG